MRTAIVTAFCLFLLMGSTACLRYYKFNNERRKVVGTSYERSDTLYIQHYVLCNSLRNIKKHPFYPIGGEVIPINEDSVVQQLFASLGKLPLRIGLKAQRENHCDSSFHRNLLIRDKKVDRSKLRALALQSGERLVLVPFIYVDNAYENQINPLPSGAISGSLVRNSFLNLAFYIYREGELVYFRSGFHTTVSRHETFEEEPKRQTQENWDKLVAMVMRDYLKRAR